MAIRVSWTGVDRDALLSALEQRGLEPQVADAEGETVIEVPCEEGDVARMCDDVFTEVESVLSELELPLVAEKAERQVFIRPPAA